tara:strand:+ start:331 stop:552 length:222 start_codon:yes stop_codon:yes gene_type:complete
MRKFHVVVEITIDEDNLPEVYPDYDIYFADIEEFIDTIYNSLETTDEDSLETLGYRVKVQEDLNLLPITYNAN